ncbi:MAG: citrate lyase subunit alpha, partial [Clostridia bacterium]|nr:citrate lyase subunit alpha [Clostridia bacterium]
AVPDATHADKVVVLTNNLVKYPNMPCAIPEHQVDYIVVIDDIGDPKGIMSGATRYTKNPKELLIAQTAAEVIDAAGYFYDGFSMQMGSGGASLAAARYLRQMMIDKGIKCRFALGGITGQIASMHEEGLVERILDVQSFDLDAAQSLKKNFDHHQISATYYASFLQDAAVDQLDFVILSALEIDTDFNVNVLTGSDGVIRGAIGGHPDTAAGASLAVVVAPLTRGRIPSIIDKVNTVVTPGATVDVVVTDQGVAVNPNRPEVAEKLKAAGIKVFTIEQLKAKAEAIVGKPEPIRYKDNIVGVVMYRDNTVIDVIRQIEE